MSILGKIAGAVGTFLGGPIGGAVAGAIGGAIDNRNAKKNRAADEARLQAATGYDFVKLRDQAEAAGFNPLTILQATGGAGYDGRGAVLATPFTPFMRETLGGMSDAFRNNFESDRNFKLEERRVGALEREVDGAWSPIAAQYGGGGSPFKRGPVVGAPAAMSYGPQLPRDKTRLRSPFGYVWMDSGAAKAAGKAWGDFLLPGEYETISGEAIGNLRALAENFGSGGPFVEPPKAKPIFIPKPLPPDYVAPDWVGAIQ